MFVGEARSLPLSGAPERWFTQVGSSLTHKYQTRLERLNRDKHSSLLQKSVSYGQKKFYNIGPWSQCHKNCPTSPEWISICNFSICFTWVGSCITCKHYTILVRLSRDEHSSLLRKFITYSRKSFITLAPWAMIGILWLERLWFQCDFNASSRIFMLGILSFECFNLSGAPL